MKLNFKACKRKNKVPVWPCDEESFINKAQKGLTIRENLSKLCLKIKTPK